jgi:hypothetical protein
MSAMLVRMKRVVALRCVMKRIAPTMPIVKGMVRRMGVCFFLCIIGL